MSQVGAYDRTCARRGVYAMFGFRGMSSTLALLLAAVLSISAGASANTEAAPSLEITESVFMAYAESHDVKYVADDVVFFNAALQEPFAIGRKTWGRPCTGSIMYPLAQ